MMDFRFSRRCRTSIPASIKREICNLKQDNPQVSDTKIWKLINDNLGLNIGRSTIADILRESDKWLTNEDDNLVRTRVPRYPLLEKALFEWYIEFSNDGNIITDDMIIEQARSLASFFNIGNEFKFSPGWLCKFKERNFLPVKRHQIEPRSYMTMPKRRVVDYEIPRENTSDIFILDVFSLYFNLIPIRNLSYIPSSDMTKWKEMVTVGLIANADGSEKIQPIIVGMKGLTFKAKTYVDYYVSERGIIDYNIAATVLNKFNRKMSRENRSVLLLVNNEFICFKNFEDLSNVKIEIIPEDSKMHYHAFNRGVIQCFKGFYRSFVIKHFIVGLNDEKKIVMPELKDVLGFIYDSWSKIHKKFLSSAYILYQSKHFTTSKKIIKEDYEKITSTLDEFIENLDIPLAKLSSDEYIDIDERINEYFDTCERSKTQFSPEELRSLELFNQMIENKITTTNKAMESAKSLIDYFEQNSEFSNKSLQVSRKLLNKMQDFKVSKFREKKIIELFKIDN